MNNEAGQDSKLIALPEKKPTPAHDDMNDVDDLPALPRRQIEHAFTRYAEFEKGKRVKIDVWRSAAEVKRQIRESIERHATACSLDSWLDVAGRRVMPLPGAPPVFRPAVRAAR